MEKNFITTLPVLPLRGLVVFPDMVLHFDAGRKKSLKAINTAMSNDQKIFISTQKDIEKNSPDFDDIFEVGVVSKIVQVSKQSDDITRVVIEGLYRAKVNKALQSEPYMIADIEMIEESNNHITLKEIALMRSVKKIFERFVLISQKIPTDIIFKVSTTDDPDKLCNIIASNIVLDYSNKQLILETKDRKDRLELLSEMLTSELAILEIESEISEKTRLKIDDSQREYFLREQRRVIDEELGDGDNPVEEADEYRTKLADLKISDSVLQILFKECSKLEKMPYGSHEATVIRTYLDTVLQLPWGNYTKEKINLQTVRKNLDKEHYGLEKIKDRIVEQLAVRKLSPNTKGQILCLVGPPGVGKTSIAKSIASSINRKYARVALGGIHDEAEIRGHRKTYVGAMPGRIINALKNAGSSNPLLVLDEIDKLSSDIHGDPSSALLEVLDSEQNNTFCDNYLEVPYDLSQVMFLITANDLSTIPTPLRDRMDIIELSSYTREEKFQIAKRHLLKKQLLNAGLTTKNVKISNQALFTLIDFYTKEAGVRSLEHRIADLLRKSAVIIVNNPEEVIKITDKNIEYYLGPKKYLDEKLSQKDEIGLVNGLAWTSVGGTLLPIEVAVMDGTGKIQITGNLGDVMEESAKIAVTCIRSHSQMLGINPDFYKTKDIHIHAPEGAVPKDGPSAGVTMATAIYSALSLKPVKRTIAMTGEITLRGKVLPIGGLKEKSMAAYKAGVQKIIIPKDNFNNVAEIDSVVKDNVTFLPVDNIMEVLNNAIVDISHKSDNKNISLNENYSIKTKTVTQ